MVKNYSVIYENVKMSLGFHEESSMSTLYVRDLKDEVYKQTGVPPEHQDLYCREGNGGVIGDLLLNFTLENMGLNAVDEVFLLKVRENAVLEMEEVKEEVVIDRMDFNPGQSIQHTIGAGGCDEIPALISRKSNLIVCVWGELWFGEVGAAADKLHKIYPFYFRTAAGCDEVTWAGMLRERLVVSATPAAIGMCHVARVVAVLDGMDRGGGVRWSLHISTTQVTNTLH